MSSAAVVIGALKVKIKKLSLFSLAIVTMMKLEMPKVSSKLNVFFSHEELF